MAHDPNPYAAPRSHDQQPVPVPRHAYPWWVKFSQWGVPSRSGLWAFVTLSLALAVGCIIYSFWDWRFLGGAAFLFSALMYWMSIRWIDRHGSW